MNLVKLFFGLTVALFALILIVPVFVLALPFWLVRGMTGSISGMLERRYLEWADLIEFDRHIGWRPKANLSSRHRADDIFSISTDQYGWRGRASIDESDIIVFGDSFAWGYGIDDQDYFADLPANLHIKAVGTVGYNLVQEYLWMQKYSESLRGKLVVWLVFYGNDLIDNIMPDMCGYRTPFLRQSADKKDWAIETSHLSPSRWPLTPLRRQRGWHYLESLGELCGPSLLSDRSYSACEFIIRKGHQLCESVEAKMMILALPEQNQLTEKGQTKLRNLRARAASADTLDTNYPDKRLAEICRKHGVSFVTTFELMPIECFKETDCHWNKAGHKRFSDLLVEIHQGIGPIDASASGLALAESMSVRDQ